MLELIFPKARANLLRLLFTKPKKRAICANWHGVATSPWALLTTNSRRCSPPDLSPPRLMVTDVFIGRIRITICFHMSSALFTAAGVCARSTSPVYVVFEGESGRKNSDPNRFIGGLPLDRPARCLGRLERDRLTEHDQLNRPPNSASEEDDSSRAPAR